MPSQIVPKDKLVCPKCQKPLELNEEYLSVHCECDFRGHVTDFGKGKYCLVWVVWEKRTGGKIKLD